MRETISIELHHFIIPTFVLISFKVSVTFRKFNTFVKHNKAAFQTTLNLLLHKTSINHTNCLTFPISPSSSLSSMPRCKRRNVDVVFNVVVINVFIVNKDLAYLKDGCNVSLLWRRRGKRNVPSSRVQISLCSLSRKNEKYARNAKRVKWKISFEGRGKFSLKLDILACKVSYVVTY